MSPPINNHPNIPSFEYYSLEKTSQRDFTDFLSHVRLASATGRPLLVQNGVVERVDEREPVEVLLGDVVNDDLVNGRHLHLGPREHRVKVFRLPRILLQLR